MVTPNGIGLSPDGATLYVAETETARAFGRSPCPAPARSCANPGRRRMAVRLVTGSAAYQRFDSLAVDAAGHVCVATLVNGGITVVSPDGASVRHVPMPDRWTTNICFGGADGRTAYLTLSSTGRLMACEWDEAGAALAY